MLVVRGDAQTLPSELNKAATGGVWFDPIFPKTDGVDVGTEARPHSECAPATRYGSRPMSGTGTAPPLAR